MLLFPLLLGLAHKFSKYFLTEILHALLVSSIVISKSTYQLPIRIRGRCDRARSKAWVCSRSLAEVAGSNPAEDMDVCLALYVVR